MRLFQRYPIQSSGQVMNHRYEPQSKFWTKIPQQAAGYYTFRLRSRILRDSTKLFAAPAIAGLQKASLTNKQYLTFLYENCRNNFFS